MQNYPTRFRSPKGKYAGLLQFPLMQELVPGFLGIFDLIVFWIPIAGYAAATYCFKRSRRKVTFQITADLRDGYSEGYSAVGRFPIRRWERNLPEGRRWGDELDWNQISLGALARRTRNARSGSLASALVPNF